MRRRACVAIYACLGVLTYLLTESQNMHLKQIIVFPYSKMAPVTLASAYIRCVYVRVYICNRIVGQKLMKQALISYSFVKIRRHIKFKCVKSRQQLKNSLNLCLKLSEAAHPARVTFSNQAVSSSVKYIKLHLDVNKRQTYSAQVPDATRM